MQSYLTLYNPMNYSLPGSSVCGISQARILEWVSICFLGDLPDPGLLHYRQILYHLSHQGIWKSVSHSVVSDSLRSHGLWPTRLLCPSEFSSKNTRVSCYFPLHRIFPTQGSNPHPLCLLHWQADSLPLSHLGNPCMARLLAKGSVGRARRGTQENSRWGALDDIRT